MPSSSLQHWFSERAAVLADLENAYRSVRGSGSGARAAAQQINQAYTMQLSAQFQGFCRDLHRECADCLVRPVADSDLRVLISNNLLFGRRLDRGNPNPGNIGADFNRLNLAFWLLVDAHRPENPVRRASLEELSEWRSASGMCRLPTVGTGDRNAASSAGATSLIAAGLSQVDMAGCSSDKMGHQPVDRVGLLDGSSYLASIMAAFAAKARRPPRPGRRKRVGAVEDVRPPQEGRDS